MFRKHLAAALSALLAVTACAPCARAQSGRRLPDKTGERGLSGRLVVTGEKSDGAAEVAGGAPAVEVRERRGKGFDLRRLNVDGSAPVVYAEDGGKHPNKADKIAGAALLGYLIFVVVVTLKSENYAPTGGTAPYVGLRR
jgi:hypothetical protein